MKEVKKWYWVGFTFGVIVGLLLGIVITTFSFATVVSSVSIDELTMDINETEMTQAMLDYMLYKGIITKESYANTSFDEDFGFVIENG